MINKLPIFINGFQRGGTNILMNLIASHPDVCMLGGEMQVVFYGRNRERFKRWFVRLLALPIVVVTGQHTFWPYRFDHRKKLPRVLWSYIDLLLYVSKMFASRNKIKNEDELNTINDIHRSRLLSKNVNGVAMTTPIFEEMYPDAVFFGLVRNGLAMCEGFVRRGWSAQKIGKMYQTVCQQMLDDAERLDNYRIVYFENMIQKTEQTIREIYGFANLDINQVDKFRLQAKKVMGDGGQRGYVFGGDQDREIHWFDLATLKGYFRADVNDNQIARLSTEDKRIFLDEAGDVMQNLGYL